MTIPTWRRKTVLKDYDMLELFSGTGNISNAFKEKGYKTLTIDFDKSMNADITADILMIKPEELQGPFKVIWGSPPCQAFSVLTIAKNWKNHKPISEKARIGIACLKKTIEIIEYWKPKYFFIENPRGMMRTLKMMKGLHRNTVTYCQYGATWQKPTDIWTNCSAWIPHRACKNGEKCHERTPRGSHTHGIQGAKNAKIRGEIPTLLCREIVAACENKQLIKQEVLC
jgi:hypothetical protein